MVFALEHFTASVTRVLFNHTVGGMHIFRMLPHSLQRSQLLPALRADDGPPAHVDSLALDAVLAVLIHFRERMPLLAERAANEAVYRGPIQKKTIYA